MASQVQCLQALIRRQTSCHESQLRRSVSWSFRLPSLIEEGGQGPLIYFLSFFGWFFRGCLGRYFFVCWAALCQFLSRCGASTWVHVGAQDAKKMRSKIDRNSSASWNRILHDFWFNLGAFWRVKCNQVGVKMGTKRNFCEKRREG